MGYKADEFRNVAVINKSNLKNKSVKIPINDNIYQFKISGIGQKAIKLEKFFYYSEIIKSVQGGNNDGLEYLIEQVIIDPNKEKISLLDSSSELRLRALANKQALKRISVEPTIGTKKYEFRIAGIGSKSIKIEIYVGYEDIAKELNSDNNINLEFILKEILVGNEVDYSIFDGVIFEEVEIEENDFEDEIIEEKQIKITKLNPDISNELISKIEGITKLIFDSIDEIDFDIFTIEDVLEQDLIKAYSVQGKSFEPIVLKNIEELIKLGIIKASDDNYYKLW